MSVEPADRLGFASRYVEPESGMVRLVALARPGPGGLVHVVHTDGTKATYGASAPLTILEGTDQ